MRLNFNYIEVYRGMIFCVEKKIMNIFFIFEGIVKVSCNKFRDKMFSVGKMIFLPKLADCREEAIC